MLQPGRAEAIAKRSVQTSRSPARHKGGEPCRRTEQHAGSATFGIESSSDPGDDQIGRDMVMGAGSIGRLSLQLATGTA